MPDIDRDCCGQEVTTLGERRVKFLTLRLFNKYKLMRIYPFAKIAARNFPTEADLNNPWIFPRDVQVVICVSQRYDTLLADVLSLLRDDGLYASITKQTSILVYR